jgi:hypothetical protein
MEVRSIAAKMTTTDAIRLGSGWVGIHSVKVAKCRTQGGIISDRDPHEVLQHRTLRNYMV